MTTQPARPAPSAPVGGYRLFVLLLMGVALGITLLKLGTPVTFEGQLPPPANLSEVLHFGWPAAWGWLGSAGVFLLAIPLIHRARGIPRWLVFAPAIWLAWQFVAAFDSINPSATRLTVAHFIVTTAWFYLGLLATKDRNSTLPVWLGLGLGLMLVLSSGFNQQFGGLAAQREFAEKFLSGELPPDQQQAAEAQGFRRVLETPLGQHKLLSKRIYGTLFYPNTLAGALLLLTPGLLAAISLGFHQARSSTRRLLMGLIATGSILCLVWSGSKGGWLIALGLIGVLILWSPRIPVQWRKCIVLAVALAGIGGLVARNVDYFKRGAQSVSARTDYWSAAANTFYDNPVTGSGPGTFADSYRTRKAAESEMARLAHNDYIQQASDSGAVGFAGLATLIVGGLWWSGRRLNHTSTLIQLTWLGLLGWAVQSLTEFGLYIPAIAWPAFFLLGSVLREAAIGIDTPPATS